MNPTHDLFGEVPEPEPVTPPQHAHVTRLKVQKSAGAKLSPAQQRFNKLLARVDNLGRQLQEFERLEGRFRQPHLQAMAELQRQTVQVQKDMALFLHGRLQQTGLTATQQKSARALLKPLLQLLVEVDGGDMQLRALFDLYHPPEEQAEQAAEQEEAKEQLRQAMEELLGRPVGPIDQFENPEDMLRSIAREMQREQEAAEAKRAARRAKRKPTAQQQKAEQTQQDAKSAMRTIFRQLASALHPDREPDPAERERKTALMSQANAAYERGDLTMLLRLQLQAEQIDEGHIARMADEKLAALSLLLKDQVAALEADLAQMQARVSHELGVRLSADTPEAVWAHTLSSLKSQAENIVAVMQSDLQRVQDDAELKRWLKEQTALAKEHARQEARWQKMGLGDF